MSFCIISTERLCLRRWIDSDTQPFIEMNKDPDVMEFFPKILTDTESIELIGKINASFDNNGFGLFAIENKLTNELLALQVLQFSG